MAGLLALRQLESGWSIVAAVAALLVVRQLEGDQHRSEVRMMEVLHHLHLMRMR